MPILNYTSIVPALRSIAEIQDALTEQGADHIAINIVNREPAAIAFALHGQIYRLPANIDAMASILEGIPRAQKTRAQAVRTAWKCIRDWVFAQLALSEAGQVAVDQVLLPYLELPGGRTVYEAYRSGGITLPSEEGRIGGG
jgi:hypothetical protein